jgi:predicted DNA-binding protein (MmcQ/YjbR family)
MDEATRKGVRFDEHGLRAIVDGWPGVESGIKWDDDLVFTVAGKMFCVLCVRGPLSGRLSFKVGDGRFLELTERPGFGPAPYLARAHWVLVADPDALPAGELGDLLRRSYELVREKLPKKTQRDLAD